MQRLKGEALVPYTRIVCRRALLEGVELYLQYSYPPIVGVNCVPEKLGWLLFLLQYLMCNSVSPAITSSLRFGALFLYWLDSRQLVGLR